jgi:hypothetical protein
VNRGDVWEHPLRGRRFVVVSTDHLTVTGTVILVEIASEVPAGTRGMLAVHLDEEDGIGGAVIGYRLNWQAAGRMAGWKYVGRISENTLEVIDMALRTSMDL